MSEPVAQSRHKIDLATTEFREMTRVATVDRSGIDKEARTVPLSFASETPVDRWFGREILDVTPEACDLERLRNGGAILVNHEWDDQVGVVLEASIDAATKKARCVAKFSRSQRGEEIFQDIVDGIRSLVSVGYIVRKMVLQSVEGDVETHRVTDWQPFEVSVVAVPADTSVGIGRSAKTETSTTAANTAASASKPSLPTRTMSAETTPTAEKPVVTSVNDLSAERSRIKDINAAAETLSARHPAHAESLRSLARKCAETGDGIDSFYRTVSNDILATKQDLAPVRQDQKIATLGLSDKDRSEYSILKAVRSIVANKPLEGREKEYNDELTKRLDRQPKGFFVPDDILADRRSAKRTMTVGTPSAGGYTVGQEILTGEFEEYLRNNTTVLKLGGRMITGLVGDVSIPRQLTGASAYWVSETGSITASEATFGQIVGKPRRIGTSVPYSKQFLAQTSLSAESFIVSDSDAAIAVDLDRVALRGTGGAEPVGIANLAAGDRSTSVTFGAAPTWAKYLEFFSSVAANNALINSPAYAASVASAVKAMATAKFANTGIPIWDEGKVGAFRAEWTTQLLTSATPVANMVIFGDFSQVLFLEWAGRDVVVDPYAGKKEGTVEITIQRLMDVVIRRAKSFAISTDSGAQ
jgi:HK97 family phage major capsid protein